MINLKAILDWKEGAKFLFGIGIFYALFYYVVIPPLVFYFQLFTAFSAGSILTLMGISNFVMGHVNPPVVLAEGMAANILPLCVGDIELAILLATILSTWDRTWETRLEGAWFGFLFVVFINPVRVALTLASGVWFGMDSMEFIHSLLFRITLLLVLVGFYALWYLRFSEPINKGKR
jgi:exosortase/archaeosortase family protein